MQATLERVLCIGRPNSTLINAIFTAPGEYNRVHEIGLQRAWLRDRPNFLRMVELEYQIRYRTTDEIGPLISSQLDLWASAEHQPIAPSKPSHIPVRELPPLPDVHWLAMNPDTEALQAWLCDHPEDLYKEAPKRDEQFTVPPRDSLQLQEGIPIWHAMRFGQIANVAAMLKLDSTLLGRDYDGESLLSGAVEYGLEGMAMFLISMGALACRDFNEDTLMHLAVYSRNPEMVSILAATGHVFDMDAVSLSRSTPLDLAGTQPAMCSALVRHGARSFLNEKGPLELMVTYGYADSIEATVIAAHHAGFHHILDSTKLFHYAIGRRSPDLLRMMLRLGTAATQEFVPRELFREYSPKVPEMLVMLEAVGCDLDDDYWTSDEDEDEDEPRLDDLLDVPISEDQIVEARYRIWFERPLLITILLELEHGF